MPFDFRLSAVLIACCLVGSCGEYCVYQGACIAPDHFSLDATPLQVDLTTANPQAPRKEFATLRIPRSYVVFANNYSSRQGPLPKQFATDHIAIRFIENGEAWNVAVDREGRSGGRTRVQEKLRPEEYVVALHANANPNARTDREASIAGHGVRQPERYEGLVHFSGGNEIYVGDASDSFASISCNERQHQSWFCTYQVDISDRISVSAQFLDFRLNGGRAYANQRARVVREVVCRFTDCETDEARRSRLAARPFIGNQKHSVCIAREMPQKTVAMGLEANVRSTFPPAVTQQTFWRLRVPAYFVAEDAWPRTDASRSVGGTVLYPEMVAAAPIDGELRRAWLTVPVGDGDRPAFDIVARDTPCITDAELSLEELADRTVQIQIRPPEEYPLTIETAPILRCGKSSGRAAHICTMNFVRDGWRVQTTFRSRWESSAESIRDRVNSYLDRITLSRDVVPFNSEPLIER